MIEQRDWVNSVDVFVRADRRTSARRCLRLVLAALLLGSLLPGCSSQGAFELLRGFHLNQCRRLPPAEQPRCIEGVPSDYEQYKAERARRQIQ